MRIFATKDIQTPNPVLIRFLWLIRNVLNRGNNEIKKIRFIFLLQFENHTLKNLQPIKKHIDVSISNDLKHHFASYVSKQFS